MCWQETVLSRINIKDENSKIVFDSTGIFSSEEFLLFLQKHKISFAFGATVNEAIEAINQNTKLFVAQIRFNSSFLEQKAEIINFDNTYLPFSINNELLKEISTKQLISLLFYYNLTNTPAYLDRSNIAAIIEKAGALIVDKSLKELEIEITTIIENVKNYENLLGLGNIWGKYIYFSFLKGDSPSENMTEKIDQIFEQSIDQGFLKSSFYASANSLKTVDKIREYIKESGYKKTALICFDGMGVAEWFLLKNILSEKGWKFNERMLFALVPTITSISRAAIFSGSFDRIYEKKLDEFREYSDFLQDKAFKSFKEGELNSPEKLLGIDATAIIYNAFDDAAHSTNFPANMNDKQLFFRNVKEYLTSSTIINELELLKTENYRIFFCADHGSVVSDGIVPRIEKYLIDQSSKRGTLCKSSELLDEKDAIRYEIPFVKEKTALLARKRAIFSNKNEKIITHGGITAEELIVPFVEVI